jgi:hypothetical protein
MVSFELLGRKEHRQQAPSKSNRWWPRRSIEPMVMPPTPLARAPELRGLKLVAVRSEKPAGSIPKILTAALEPASGERVEMAEVYQRYNLTCAAEGNSAVPPAQFADPLARFCKGAGIRTKVDGDHVYLLNVRIGSAQSKDQHATM